MADVKHSADPTNASPALTDLLLSLTGTPENENIAISALKTLIQKQIQLDTGGGYAHSAGQVSYDLLTKTILADTGFSDVRVNVGQEEHIRFFNDTGVTILNGMVINAAGVNTANSVVMGILADASSPQTASSVIGVATHDVPDQTVGLATTFGEVRDFDTSTFSVGGIIYLSETAGLLTATRPTYPAEIVIMGTVVKAHATEGILFTNVTPFRRFTGDKSYSFTSNGIGTGVYYIGGYYDAPATDANLTQASPTQAHGTANAAYGAHAFGCFAGAGTVDTGQVGLRVNGTSILNGTGVRAGSDSQVITEDITTLTADQYAETSKKWLGAVEFELYIVSGSPTTYSLDFNYGFAKYEDIGNHDYTAVSIDVVGLAGANDTAFNIELLHHRESGWTYAATGFVPGNGNIVDWASDMSPEDNLSSGENFGWKRSGLAEHVDGDSNNGIMLRVTTGANNSVQSMDCHLGVVLESLTV